MKLFDLENGLGTLAIGIDFDCKHSPPLYHTLNFHGFVLIPLL
jgi:hypothetical protein